MSANKLTAPLTRDALIEQNAQLVPYAVGLLLRRMPNLPESVQSDAMSGGYLGLCQAADRFDPNRGAFSTLAVLYIQSEAKDALSRSHGDTKAKKAGVSVGSLDAPVTMGNDEARVLVDMMADEAAQEPFNNLLDGADESDRIDALWA